MSGGKNVLHPNLFIMWDLCGIFSFYDFMWDTCGIDIFIVRICMWDKCGIGKKRKSFLGLWD